MIRFGKNLNAINIIHLLDVRHANALQDKLRHSVPFVNLEVFLSVVKQHHAYRPPIVVIHDSRTDIDHLLHRQSGSGGDPRIRVWGDGDGEIRLDESLASGGDRSLVGTGQKNVARKHSGRGKYYTKLLKYSKKI